MPGSAARRLSTSAITTVSEHDGGHDLHPATSPGVTPCVSVSRAAARLPSLQRRARRRPGCLRLRGRRSPFLTSPAPPRRSSAESFAPTPMGPGTSCREARVHAGRRAGRRGEEPGSHESAGGQRKRRPLQGCISLPSAKKVGIRAPEVPSLDRRPRRAGPLLTPQVVTNLWSSWERRLFYRREIPWP
jgi:hypothetical protein